MSDPRPRPRYWLLLVFAGLMLSPPAWAAAALIGVGIAGTVLGGIREARARRARPEAARAPHDATVLGVDAAGKPVVIGDRELSAHGLIVGASGAGKSTTLLTILTDHIRRGRPVIAIDMKGSPAFAHDLEGAASAAGRVLRRWTPEGPSVWNPLAHGNATELKDKLIATERFTEPHYQRAAERYLQTTLQVLGELHPGRAATLGEVVGAMDPRRLATMARGLPGARAERLHEYLSGIAPDQLSAVRGLATRLAIISESHTGRFLEPGDGQAGIDLRSALAGEEVVLFSLNSSTYGKLSAQLGTLVVQDLIAATGHRLASTDPHGRAPALIAIDEFSALGADNVVALLARGREAGVSVLVATQELADLDRAAPGFRDQVLGNTAIKIAHRQDVPGSAQTIAQMAGTVKHWEESRQFGSGLLRDYDTGRGTRREGERFAVHPNEIKTLRTGDAVLITKVPGAAVRTVNVAAPAREGPARPAREGRPARSPRERPQSRPPRDGPARD